MRSSWFHGVAGEFLSSKASGAEDGNETVPASADLVDEREYCRAAVAVLSVLDGRILDDSSNGM